MIQTLILLGGLSVAFVPPVAKTPPGSVPLKATAPATATATAPVATAKAKPATPPAVAPAAPELHPLEARIIEKTNLERVRHGLPPLAVDTSLVKSARQHAAWMTNNRSMVHTNKPVAENIAMGQHSSGEVLSAWMNSSGHRANILNPGHRRIGVAAYVTPSGTIFWCQQFLH